MGLPLLWEFVFFHKEGEGGRQRWSASLTGKDGEFSVFVLWGGNKNMSCFPSAV